MTREKNTKGSSPRVRGAAMQDPVWNREVGIIPARAGSSFVGLWNGIVTWDHPRACGEQRGVFGTIHSSSGSSPRVRGADLKVIQALFD